MLFLQILPKQFTEGFLLMIRYCLIVLFILSVTGVSMAQRSDSLPWGGSVQALGATNFGGADDASLAVRIRRDAPK